MRRRACSGPRPRRPRPVAPAPPAPRRRGARGRSPHGPPAGSIPLPVHTPASVGSSRVRATRAVRLDVRPPHGRGRGRGGGGGARCGAKRRPPGAAAEGSAGGCGRRGRSGCIGGADCAGRRIGIARIAGQRGGRHGLHAGAGRAGRRDHCQEAATGRPQGSAAPGGALPDGAAAGAAASQATMCTAMCATPPPGPRPGGAARRFSRGSQRPTPRRPAAPARDLRAAACRPAARPRPCRGAARRASASAHRQVQPQRNHDDPPVGLAHILAGHDDPHP